MKSFTYAQKSGTQNYAGSLCSVELVWWESKINRPSTPFVFVQQLNPTSESRMLSVAHSACR